MKHVTKLFLPWQKFRKINWFTSFFYDFTNFFRKKINPYGWFSLWVQWHRHNFVAKILSNQFFFLLIKNLPLTGTFIICYFVLELFWPLAVLPSSHFFHKICCPRSHFVLSYFVRLYYVRCYFVHSYFVLALRETGCSCRTVLQSLFFFLREINSDFPCCNRSCTVWKSVLKCDHDFSANSIFLSWNQSISIICSIYLAKWSRWNR